MVLDVVQLAIELRGDDDHAACALTENILVTLKQTVDTEVRTRITDPVAETLGNLLKRSHPGLVRSMQKALRFWTPRARRLTLTRYVPSSCRPPEQCVA